MAWYASSMQLFSYTLTHKRLETYGCVISSVAAAALVLKYQASSSHSADKYSLLIRSTKKDISAKLIFECKYSSFSWN